MLFVSPTNTKRFTLYHLEESEIYIQDFFGHCTFYDPVAKEQRKHDKGKFYLCSRTIVYESDRKSIPLIKIKFENMKDKPIFSTQATTQTMITS